MILLNKFVRFSFIFVVVEQLYVKIIVLIFSLCAYHKALQTPRPGCVVVSPPRGQYDN